MTHAVVAAQHSDMLLCTVDACEMVVLCVGERGPIELLCLWFGCSVRPSAGTMSACCSAFKLQQRCSPEPGRGSVWFS